MFLWSLLYVCLPESFHRGAFWQTSSLHFSPQLFLSWFPAMNLIFLLLLFDGGLMNADRSQGQKNPAGRSNSLLFVFLYDFCSWRDFGRTITSWKIHFCPTVSPLVRHVVGWESEESWSFWNNWKFFQTDRRQHRPSGDVEELGLFVTWLWFSNLVLFSLMVKANASQMCLCIRQDSCHFSEEMLRNKTDWKKALIWPMPM